MGWLDGSQNNIVIDAVLTDTGRQLLARNDGSFSIVKFAMADDEVDYTLIEKYGRTVGKEKIEKNTPVFEAQTNSGVALKYRLVSLSNPSVSRYPKFKWTSNTGDSSTYASVSPKTPRVNINVTQDFANTSFSNPEQVESTYKIDVPSKFLSIPGSTPDYVSPTGTATYTKTKSSSTALGGSNLNLTLGTGPILDTDYDKYGDGSTIDTEIVVQGLTTGTTTTIPFKISKF